MINRLCLFLALALACLSAVAQTVTPATYYWIQAGSQSLYDSDLAKGCQRGISFLNTKNGSSYVYTGYRLQGASTTTDYWCQAKTGTNAPIDFVGAYKRVCAGSTPYWDAAKSTCVATFTPPPPECGLPAGTPFTFGAWEGWGPLGGDMPETQTVTGYPTSGKNCNLQGSPTLEACYSIVEEGKKHYYCVYNGVSTGTVAAGGASNAPDGPPPDGSVQPERTDQPPKEAPPSTGQCPKGSVMAGYNSAGTPMCVGTGTAPPSTPTAPPTKTTTATTSNADGSTTTTTTTITTNVDGSTTTVKDIVTTLPNGGGTTTSQTRDTTKTPSGAAGTETKPEEANFCKQNPTLSVCRNSSVSGTCGQIACTGDAIQCATLRAAAAMQCSQAEAEAALKASPQTALGNSILGGTDPMKGDIEAALKGTEVDLSKPALDSAGFLGGGSCLPNRSFAVAGHSVTVDFTTLCTNIQPLRAVIMACAFIAAYMLVSRSVVQS